MSRVIVVGAAGMLGSEVARAVERARHEVLRTRRRAQSGWIEFDAETQEPEVVLAPRPDLVVNCAGVLASEIDPDDAESTRRAEAVNTRFPQELAHAAAARGVRVVHVSTDAVFRDDAGRCLEGDDRFATDIYGTTKRRGEPAGDHVLTLRCSFVGRDRQRRRGLLEWLLGLPDGEAPGFVDQLWNGVVTTQVAPVCSALADDGFFQRARAEGGIHHLFEDPPLTKHDLVSLIVQTFQLDVAVVPVESGRPITRVLGSRHTVLREHLESLPPRAASLEALARGGPHRDA